MTITTSWRRVRMLGDCLIYAGAIRQGSTERPAASLLCAVDGAPFTITCGGQAVTATALLVRPMVHKTIYLPPGHPTMLLIDLEPNYPSYRRFHGIPDPGVLALPATQATRIRALARDFAAGQLIGEALDAQVREMVDVIARTLPPPPPLDERVRLLMSLLNEDPGIGLSQLTARLGISPHHASRLFCQNMGLSMRRYAQSVKIRAAASFLGSHQPLTYIAQAAGFADSAHFAKVWMQSYAHPPSHFFNPEGLQLDTTDQPDWLTWYFARRDRSLPPPAPGAQVFLLHRRPPERAGEHREGDVHDATEGDQRFFLDTCLSSI